MARLEAALLFFSFSLFCTVHDVNFFSSNQDEPHTVTVIENMPTAIDCGPFSSTPPSDLAWDVPFGSSFVSVSIDNEGATIGLDHRLYLLEPRLSQNDDIFACHLRNTLLGVISNGFVRINVEGMCITSSWLQNNFPHGTSVPSPMLKDSD